MMGLISEYKKHWRHRVVKKCLDRGEYFKAAEWLLNGLPNILFPFSFGKTPPGAISYDKHAAQCKKKFGARGANSIRCWRVYFSRQILGHALGGFLFSIVPCLVLFFALDFYLWMFLCPLAIGIIYVVKESGDFKEERKKVEETYGVDIAEAKHGVDVLFWILGSALLPIVLSFIKGIRF